MTDGQIVRADGDEERPLVTFALFAYNQEKYIREAVEGALAQTYSPLEIILSDDCSSDQTFEIMKDTVNSYRGPHTVKLNKNSTNLGLPRHVNRIFEMAVGDLIIAAAGDDISLPHRADQLARAYEKTGRSAMLLHSSAIKLDRHNNTNGILVPPIVARKMALNEIALTTALYIGATGAWSKRLYTDFGSLKFARVYEDLILGFRAALSGAMLYVDEPLVKYRYGIGISEGKYNVDKGIDALFRERYNQNLDYIDILMQRIEDVSKFSGSVDEGIVKLLRKELSFQLDRRSLYQSPLRFLFRILRKNPIHVTKAIWQEFKFFIFLVQRKFLVR